LHEHFFAERLKRLLRLAKFVLLIVKCKMVWN